ncbi:MAG: hypothetical protein JSW40_03340 [Candidatus Omnitrophota bacterium]|nr:MAG: hypothetical protein JSW40_03340 [Candidatus Omnitrophota bacterium]
MNELRLRPMEIGDILDSAFRLYKNNFAKFIHIMAPIYILGFIAGVIYQQAIATLGLPGRGAALNIGFGVVGVGFSALFGLISWILKFVAVGALVHSVSASYLGEDIRYNEAYKRVWRQFWPLVGVGFLAGLMIFIGKVMLIIPGIVLAVFLSLVAHVMVLEKEGVGGSIGRSFELVAYSFWKTFLVCLVAYVIILVVSGAAYLPFFIWGMIRSFSIGSMHQFQYPLGIQILQIAITNFIELLTAPFWMVALTLLYYDIRIRKEGFDLEVMAHGLGYDVSSPRDTSGQNLQEK